jgi:tetratricopeptide (TPR) repeat protein
MQNRAFHFREAVLCQQTGDLESAEAHFYAAYEASSEAFLRFGNDVALFELAQSCFELGKFEFEQGDVDEGDRFFIEALQTLEAAGSHFKKQLSHFRSEVENSYIQCWLYAQAKAAVAKHHRYMN